MGGSVLLVFAFWLGLWGATSIVAALGFCLLCRGAATGAHKLLEAYEPTATAAAA